MRVLWIPLLLSFGLALGAEERDRDSEGGKTYGQRFAYHYEIPLNGNEKPKVEYAYTELGDPSSEQRKFSSNSKSPRRSPSNRSPPPPFPFALPHQYPDTAVNQTFFDSAMPSPEPPQPKRTHTYRSPPHKHKMPEFHEPSPPAPSPPSPPEHDNRDHENYIQQRYGKSEDAAMRTAKTLQDIQNRINELMQNIGSEPGYGNYGDGEYGRNGYAPYGGRGYGNGFGGGPGYGGFEGDFGGFRDAFSGFSHPFFPREHNHINNRGRRRSARSRNDVHDDYRHPDMRDDWFWTK